MNAETLHGVLYSEDRIVRGFDLRSEIAVDGNARSRSGARPLIQLGGTFLQQFQHESTGTRAEQISGNIQPLVYVRDVLHRVGDAAELLV